MTNTIGKDLIFGKKNRELEKLKATNKRLLKKISRLTVENKNLKRKLDN